MNVFNLGTNSNMELCIVLKLKGNRILKSQGTKIESKET